MLAISLCFCWSAERLFERRLVTWKVCSESRLSRLSGGDIKLAKTGEETWGLGRSYIGSSVENCYTVIGSTSWKRSWNLSIVEMGIIEGIDPDVIVWVIDAVRASCSDSDACPEIGPGSDPSVPWLTCWITYLLCAEEITSSWLYNGR